MLISAFIILGVFISVVILILTGKVNRLVASIGGALITTLSLLYIDHIEVPNLVEFLVGRHNYANLHTILFIFGMMIIIAICQEGGLFTFVAFKMVQQSRGNRFYILYILCFLTFIFSSVLSNILCIFIILPLTIRICKILNINPIPYILSEAMVVNLGGLLFVISSIPNLLIRQTIGWSFIDYFIDVGFFSLFLFLITLIFLSRYNRYNLLPPKINLIEILLDYNAWMFVKDRKMFYKSLLVLIITLILIVTLPLFYSINIDIIAMNGAFVSIILIMNKDFEKLWKSLDLELIFYLSCIFYISEALEYTGILFFISRGINNITGGDILLTAILLLWLSAILSSFIHNAAITKVLIPVVIDLSAPENQSLYFSAISMGTVLGENLSAMGDNLVIITNTKKAGYKLEFSTFIKLGIKVTLINLIAATFFIIMKVNLLFFIIGIILLISMVGGIIFIMSLTSYEIKIIEEKCVGCGTCIKNCPLDLPKIIDNTSNIDITECIGCGICLRHCPEKAIIFMRKGPRNIFISPPEVKETQ